MKSLMEINRRNQTSTVSETSSEQNTVDFFDRVVIATMVNSRLNERM